MLVDFHGRKTHGLLGFFFGGGGGGKGGGVSELLD